MEDSADSSGLPARNLVEQEETSNLVVTELEPMEWTDEKHCLFLKSMESTFVNQLYNSIDLFGWHSHKTCPSGSKSSKNKSTGIRVSSGQFKVLRDGCWSKIEFRRDEPEVDKDEKSKVPIANPWIQHYRSSKMQPIRKLPSSSPIAPSAIDNGNSAHNFQPWDRDSVGTDTEGTDQNFNDEALEEEMSGRINEITRMKAATDSISSNDQVVPFDKIVLADDAVEDNVHIPPRD